MKTVASVNSKKRFEIRSTMTLKTPQTKESFPEVNLWSALGENE